MIRQVDQSRYNIPVIGDPRVHHELAWYATDDDAVIGVGAARSGVGWHPAADQEGASLASRYPLIVQAVNKLKVRGCLIDGEAVCCNECRALTS